MLFGSQLFNISNYALCLPKSKHDISVVPLIPLRKKGFYRDYDELLKELRLRNVRIAPVFLNAPDDSFRHFLNPYIFVRDARNIFRTLQLLAPDVVVGFYVLNAIPLAVFKRFLHYDLSLVATGGDINLHNGLFYRIVRKIVYSQSDLIFAVSRELSGKILRENGCEPILLPTGTDVSFFRKIKSKSDLRKKWNLRNEDIVILTVCNLVRHKGVDVLIEAFSLFQNRLPYSSAHLFIVGEGPEERDLKGLASSLGLDRLVSFLGYRSRRELLELHNLADLFVLASYSEGLPFVLLEAMACESICVATPVGDVGKVIRDGDNGFLMKTGDPLDLAEKVWEILSFPEERASKIRAQARKTVEEEFDLRKIVDKMIQVASTR